MPTPNLGVLASGGGTNLQALIDAHERGDLAAPVAVVIANNSGAGALDRARKHGITALHISGKTHADPDAAIADALAAHDVGVVALAGYLKKIGPRTLSAYEGRILNIHPGPLPRFGGQGMYGRHVHEAVLAAGVERSGPTVFAVTANYDEGPILAHEPVEVRAGDDAAALGARVLVAEHALYWRVIQERFCLD